MLEESDKIDFIVATPDGKLLLAITDSGLTTDAEQRFALLLAKLRMYGSYIVSDEFSQEHPGKTPRDVVIRVICAQQPTEQMSGLTDICPSGQRDLLIPVQFQVLPKP